MLVKIFEKTEYERVIGEILPADKLFVKNVSLKKHLFKKFDAWGLDAEYFTDVLLPGNYKIRVLDKDEGNIYEASAEKVKAHGKYFHFQGKGPDGEDHRAQIFLSRRFWDIRPGYEF